MTSPYGDSVLTDIPKSVTTFYSCLRRNGICNLSPLNCFDVSNEELPESTRDISKFRGPSDKNSPFEISSRFGGFGRSSNTQTWENITQCRLHQNAMFENFHMTHYAFNYFDILTISESNFTK